MKATMKTKNAVTKAIAPEQPTVTNDPKYGSLLVLNPSSKYTFQFGPAKARLILANIEAIRSFANSQPSAK